MCAREREREWERAEPGASYSALLAKTRLDVNEIGKTYKKKKMEFGYDGVCVCGKKMEASQTKNRKRLCHAIRMSNHISFLLEMFSFFGYG